MAKQLALQGRTSAYDPNKTSKIKPFSEVALTLTAHYTKQAVCLYAHGKPSDYSIFTGSSTNNMGE